MGALILHPNPRDDVALREENRRLHDDLTLLRTNIGKLRAELDETRVERDRMSRAIVALQHSLRSQYMALRAIFGEIEAAGVEDAPPHSSGVTPAAPQFDPRWEAWKQKFAGTKKAAVIDALLNHGSMSRAQLRAATNSGWSTIDKALAQLSGIDIIRKSGDKWSLKT